MSNCLKIYNDTPIEFKKYNFSSLSIENKNTCTPIYTNYGSSIEYLYNRLYSVYYEYSIYNGYIKGEMIYNTTYDICNKLDNFDKINKLIYELEDINKQINDIIEEIQSQCYHEIKAIQEHNIYNPNDYISYSDLWKLKINLSYNKHYEDRFNDLQNKHKELLNNIKRTANKYNIDYKKELNVNTNIWILKEC